MSAGLGDLILKVYQSCLDQSESVMDKYSMESATCTIDVVLVGACRGRIVDRDRFDTLG